MTLYQRLLEHIYSLILPRGMKLGLDNMRAILAHLGNPEKKVKAVHIAGTNGKGSTSTKVAKALQEDGRFGPVGLYTSPHISCFRERIMIDGKVISEGLVVVHLSKILALAAAQKIEITFFEAVTVLAFLCFLEKGVSIAVLETGLGGRLDATNVCEPICSVITSISLDHKELLGNTLEAIALEKAGIIKKGVPVVIGPNVPFNVVHKEALRLSSPLHVVEERYDDYELENQAIAKKCLSVLGITDPKGLQNVPPCRFQQIRNKMGIVVLDVAHNPDGILHLFHRLHITFPQKSIIAVFAASKDKDVHSGLSLFLPVSKHVFLHMLAHQGLWRLLCSCKWQSLSAVMRALFMHLMKSLKQWQLQRSCRIRMI